MSAHHTTDPQTPQTLPIPQTPPTAPGDDVPRLPGDVELISYAEAAAVQDLPVTRVGQQVRDGQLVALGGRIPASFLQHGAPVKHLGGVITLLRDGGYTDAEIVAWLFRADESLPGTPVDALRADRGTEIKRRAQAAAF